MKSLGAGSFVLKALLLAAALAAGHAHAQSAKDPKKPPPKKDDAGTKAPAVTAEEAQRLMALRERRRGPTFPGIDPAFLVLPRPTERSDLPRELLGLELPDVAAVAKLPPDHIKALYPSLRTLHGIEDILVGIDEKDPEVAKVIQAMTDLRPHRRADLLDALGKAKLAPEVRSSLIQAVSAKVTPLEMADRALTYLVRAQEPAGGWSDTQYPGNTGVTALCALAFMGEGSRPRVGKYGRDLEEALAFLLKNVQTSGVIAGKGSNKLGPAYEHTYSTLALLFAYGDMPWRPQCRDVISRAIQALANAQRLDGGWRYQFSREGHSDISVTANVLWVMRTAKKCGFTVDSKSIQRGVNFVMSCAMPDRKHFRYRYHGILASAEGLTGSGLIALANDGRFNQYLLSPRGTSIPKDDPNFTDSDRMLLTLIHRTSKQIAYEYRRYTVKDLKERRYFVYGCFYASLAMYMCGDDFWAPWYRKAAMVLAHIQKKDGEFEDRYGNTVYSTALAALVLLAPKSYLPIYER